MGIYDKPDASTRTTLDPALAPIRLKEGIVPSDTGIFLQVEEGPCAGSAFGLSRGGVYLIGRDGADIVLDDAKISRKHAEIGLYGPEAWVLRDLASTNGTCLNGRRISDKHKLHSGDVIRVGDTFLRFTVLEGSLPLSE